MSDKVQRAARDRRDAAEEREDIARVRVCGFDGRPGPVCWPRFARVTRSRPFRLPRDHDSAAAVSGVLLLESALDVRA
jgi:hypothetical protein